jgi:prepilin-type processing-associated H-X9-DG protein
MDDLYLGYLLNALTPAEKAAVESHLRTHPADEAKLEGLRRVLRPLEADRDDIVPPPGLVAATLARVAEHIIASRRADDSTSTDKLPIVPMRPPLTCESRAEPRPEPVPARAPLRRWVEVGVAAGIGFLVVGLGMAGVQKIRWDSQKVACQNNLRVMYQGLSGYADSHAGHYPQIGPDSPAGSFVATLVAADQFPGDLKLVCPAADNVPPELIRFRPDPLAPPGLEVIQQVGYAYTLGFRGPNGELYGIRWGAPDRTPLAADLPAAAVAPLPGPLSPHGRGQNVLYADGRVQFCTNATVGPLGDDIYRNAANEVRAGLHRIDAVLGRAADVP